MPEQPTSTNDLIVAVKNALDRLIETVTAYQEANTEQREKEINAESKTVVRLPVEVTKYYESEERERSKTNSRDKIRIGLEIAGVAAAIVLAILTFLTLRTFNSQLSEMQKQTTTLQKQAEQAARDTQTQIDLFRQQAEAAQRQAGAAELSMITGTRAYLALERVRLYCPICDPKFVPPPGQPAPERNKDASVSLFFVNSGRSPARDIDEAAILYVAPINKSFKFPEPPDIMEQPKHMMVQGSTEFPLEITRSFDAMNVIMARPNQIPCGNSTFSPPCQDFLYFYGHVSYTDVFKARHTLIYCVQYLPETYASPEKWSACPYHNEEYEGDYKRQ